MDNPSNNVVSIFKAATAVVGDTTYLSDKPPGESDCFGINGRKLFALKQALAAAYCNEGGKRHTYDESGTCFECGEPKPEDNTPA